MSNELLKAMIADLRFVINKCEAKMNNTIEKLPSGDFQVKPETPNPYHFDNNQILQDSCTPEAAGYYEKQ
jgi:hypothetical protein